MGAFPAAEMNELSDWICFTKLMCARQYPLVLFPMAERDEFALAVDTHPTCCPRWILGPMAQVEVGTSKIWKGRIISQV